MHPRLLVVAERRRPPVAVRLPRGLGRGDRRRAGDRRPAAGLDDPRPRLHAVRPLLDDDGLLHHRDSWVSLSPVEQSLASVMLDRFGAVVTREMLADRAWPTGVPTRNALDVHVLRLRRRIAPLGLEIRTVRSRGYLMQSRRVAAPAVAARGGSSVRPRATWGSTAAGRSPTRSRPTGGSSKVASTPDDPARAVERAIDALSGSASVDVLAHGTTVATNALLERRGARGCVGRNRRLRRRDRDRAPGSPVAVRPVRRSARAAGAAVAALRRDGPPRRAGRRDRAVRRRSPGDSRRGRRDRRVPAARRSRPAPRAGGRRRRCGPRAAAMSCARTR